MTVILKKKSIISLLLQNEKNENKDVKNKNIYANIVS
jgi:hypothetical protein